MGTLLRLQTVAETKPTHSTNFESVRPQLPGATHLVRRSLVLAVAVDAYTSLLEEGSLADQADRLYDLSVSLYRSFRTLDISSHAERNQLQRLVFDLWQHFERVKAEVTPALEGAQDWKRHVAWRNIEDAYEDLFATGSFRC